MTPGFMLQLLAASGLVEMHEAAARARGVDDACTVPVGLKKVADSATRKVADQATQKVAESARGPVAEQATFQVAHSATKNWPPPNGRAPVTAGCPYHCGNCWAGPDQPYTFCPLSPGPRQSLARSLPATHHHDESDTMISIPSLPTAAQVQALSGALDAAGRIHAQAFGLSTIPGLIDALAKCQDALAGFLPKGEQAPVESDSTPSEPLASPTHAPCPQGARDDQEPRKTAADLSLSTVLALVATAYKATENGLAGMENEYRHLGQDIDQQRHRLAEMAAFFGGGERAETLIAVYCDTPKRG